MAKRFSRQTKEKARAMRASGATYAGIAREIGCTAACVRYWCDVKARAENNQRMTVNNQRRNHLMAVVEDDRPIMVALYAFVIQWNEDHGTYYEVDHIVPAHKGGKHKIDNLRILPMSTNRTGRPRKRN